MMLVIVGESKIRKQRLKINASLMFSRIIVIQVEYNIIKIPELGVRKTFRMTNVFYNLNLF